MKVLAYSILAGALGGLTALNAVCYFVLSGHTINAVAAAVCWLVLVALAFKRFGP